MQKNHWFLIIAILTTLPLFSMQLQQEAASGQFLFVQLDVTGFEPKKSSILAVGAILTDYQLEVHKEFYSVVYNSPESLKEINKYPYLEKYYAQTDLLQQSQVSSTEISQVSGALEEMVTCNEKTHLAPIIVGGDKTALYLKFIKRHMPNVSRHLALKSPLYIPTIRRLVKVWKPQDVPYKPRPIRTAFDGAHALLEELKLYRSRYFQDLMITIDAEEFRHESNFDEFD